jgi:hypothetical protein
VNHFFEDGRIHLDNNANENKIRPLALGRKNFLFAGSHEGAKRIAMMYSFFASCKEADVNPYAWMTETLIRIGNHLSINYPNCSLIIFGMCKIWTWTDGCEFWIITID